MTEDLHYSSRSENKRKFDDQGAPPSLAAPASGRRSTGFSAPIASSPLDAAAPLSYNSVPPPPDGIQLAKQRAQEIAARIFSDAEAKRPRVENGGGADDSSNKGTGFDQPHNPFAQPLASQVGMTTPLFFASYGYAGSNKKIDVPNGRVGVIIGKSGETIKYLQVQSGARIQVTRDMDADPNSHCRPIELIGTPDQISKAEQLINDVLAEAESGGSGIASARKFTSTPTDAEHFSMKVPNNKVGLIIGKGGETIKNMQATSGARIQVIPLHLPPGDPTTERTVHIDGTNEQIESAKLLVNDVISENRPRNPQTPGGYRPPRPPISWAPPHGVQPMQQSGYAYMQPGAYPGQPPQYSMPQPPYGGYIPPASTGWDQSSNPAAQQTTQATGYDYYNQQQPQQQQQQQQQQPIGGSSAPTDNNSYNYNQLPLTYTAPGSYADPTYSQSSVSQQQGYGQAGSYTQAGYTQQGYGFGSAQDGSAQGAIQQTPPPGQPSTTQQGYAAQQPTTAAQTGYVMPPTSQSGYGNQPPAAQSGSSSQGQTPPPAQAVYGQGQQPATSQTGYAQPTQIYGQFAQGYNQPAPTSGYTQPSAYAPGFPQASYGQSYVQQQQQQQSYNDSYAGVYAQPSYSSDATHGSYEVPLSTQTAPSGVTKESPKID